MKGSCCTTRQPCLTSPCAAQLWPPAHMHGSTTGQQQSSQAGSYPGNNLVQHPARVLRLLCTTLNPTSHVWLAATSNSANNKAPTTADGKKSLQHTCRPDDTGSTTLALMVHCLCRHTRDNQHRHNTLRASIVCSACTHTYYNHNAHCQTAWTRKAPQCTLKKCMHILRDNEEHTLLVLHNSTHPPTLLPSQRACLSLQHFTHRLDVSTAVTHTCLLGASHVLADGVQGSSTREGSALH